MDGTMNASWAICCNHAQAVARFPRMEPLLVGICATFREISHVFGGGAAKVLWTIWNRTATILITPV
jgi:hypothetical protein